MLQEIRNLNQTSEDLKRRWFRGDGLDLYVWQNPDGSIYEFQFSFNKPDERVIKWTPEHGLTRHSVISENTSPYHMDASAMLGTGADWPLQEARELFMRHGRKLEHDMYEFILRKLR